MLGDNTDPDSTPVAFAPVFVNSARITHDASTFPLDLCTPCLNSPLLGQQAHTGNLSLHSQYSHAELFRAHEVRHACAFAHVDEADDDTVTHKITSMLDQVAPIGLFEHADYVADGPLRSRETRPLASRDGDQHVSPRHIDSTFA